MNALADAIVLEVGFGHWQRMHARHPMIDHMRAYDFVLDIGWRVGAIRAVEKDWRKVPARPVVDYLIMRLVPGRLALPAGYVLGG